MPQRLAMIHWIFTGSPAKYLDLMLHNAGCVEHTMDPMHALCVYTRRHNRNCAYVRYMVFSSKFKHE